jgi:ferredoxin
VTVTIAPTCTACGLCLATCPTHALLRAPLRPRVVDDRCTDCWLCIEICPVDAIATIAGEAR